jgi:hypothetical protein
MAILSVLIDFMDYKATTLNDLEPYINEAVRCFVVVKKSNVCFVGHSGSGSKRA